MLSQSLLLIRALEALLTPPKKVHPTAPVELGPHVALLPGSMADATGQTVYRKSGGFFREIGSDLANPLILQGIMCDVFRTVLTIETKGLKVSGDRIVFGRRFVNHYWYEVYGRKPECN